MVREEARCSQVVIFPRIVLFAFYNASHTVNFNNSNK